MIKEKERIIQNYLQVTKGNFIKIGGLFKEILQKQLYKELDFNSFEEYADSARFKELFQMKSRHAFNMIEVNNKFGDVQLQLLQSVGISKLIEIAYVSNRESREDLVKRAPDLNLDEVKKEVKKISPEKKPLIDTPSENYYKLIREFNNFKAQLEQVNELYDKYLVWKEKSTQISPKLSSEVNILEGLWKNIKKE